VSTTWRRWTNAGGMLLRRRRGFGTSCPPEKVLWKEEARLSSIVEGRVI